MMEIGPITLSRPAALPIRTRYQQDCGAFVGGGSTVRGVIDGTTRKLRTYPLPRLLWEEYERLAAFLDDVGPRGESFILVDDWGERHRVYWMESRVKARLNSGRCVSLDLTVMVESTGENLFSRSEPPTSGWWNRAFHGCNMLGAADGFDAWTRHYAGYENWYAYAGVPDNEKSPWLAGEIGQTFTFSCYAKRDSGTQPTYCYSSSSDFYSEVSGILLLFGSSYANVQPEVWTFVAGTVWRLSITFTVTSAPLTRQFGNVHSGFGTEAFQLTGFQLRHGTTAGAYIKTVGAPFP